VALFSRRADCVVHSTKYPGLMKIVVCASPNGNFADIFGSSF
jgi:hypothetical protein